MKIDELKTLINTIENGLKSDPSDLDLLYKFLFVIQNNFEVLNSQDDEINQVLTDSIKKLIENYQKVDFSQNKCYNNNIKECCSNGFDSTDFLYKNFSENIALAWQRRLKGVF